jgi:2,4-dienoyl-CoA reductase-like NADH-dependent reductase (Old Yellow Enzyme family)
MGDPVTQPGFEHLFTPLRIGPVEARNRIVSSGHDTVMAVNGVPGDQLIAYHEARARGGVGLIVVQVAGVHQSARYSSRMLMADDDSCVPAYERLVDAIHAHGALAFQQLFHDGRELMESDDGTMPVALAPSAVPNERFHIMPRAMPTALVHEMISAYATAARRMRLAGYDGVEVVASHGYLPAQFLNPRVNQRLDEYGGDVDGRLRFLREVLAAVRSAVGPHLAVGLRISIGEESEEGLTAAESLESVRLLDADGLIDYVSVVAGTSATLAGSDHIAPPMTRPVGYTAPLAEWTKAVISVPVMVAGRINQPQDAELILARGQADATVMTRALICDPDLPAKAAAGRLDEIRACIGCNQACIGHFHAGYPISCIQRPETGREIRYGVRVPAQTAKDIVVVGGGPGGLKAATVAAERGHRVRLFEATRRLGGQILLAQEIPGRAEFGGAAMNLQREAERAGVTIELGVTVDAAILASLDPDAVVIATGAGPRIPALELIDDPFILSSWDVLRGSSIPAGHVVVADWRCDWIGAGTAIRLAQLGHRVTLGVTGYHAAQRLQQYVRDDMLRELERLRVDVLPLVRIYGADADTVYFQHVLTSEPVMINDVSALVLSQGHLPVDGLLTELEAAGSFEVHAVGDCLSPRTVEEAVLEGLRVGSLL